MPTRPLRRAAGGSLYLRAQRSALAAALCLFPLHGAAHAGAWTLEDGKGQLIVTGTWTNSSETFDDDGDLFSGTRYGKAEITALAEYGLTDWLTLMAKPAFEAVDIDGETDAERMGMGYTELGGRVRLVKRDFWVLSAQSTVLAPGGYDEANPALIGHTDPEVDVRGLFGYGLSLGDWTAFVDVQLAQRFRFSDPPDESRIDVTFGVRPVPDWLLMAQSFNVISQGEGGSGFPSYYYSKLQLSAVYELTPAFSVQLGGTTTYAGHNALQENGVLLGVWYKF